MRGGAFLNGKEGRVGFRTNSTSRAVSLFFPEVSVPLKGNRRDSKDY